MNLFPHFEVNYCFSPRTNRTFMLPLSQPATEANSGCWRWRQHLLLQRGNNSERSKKPVKPLLLGMVLVTRPVEQVFTAVYPQLRLNT